MDEALVGALLASTLRVSTPLILCALAGLLSERAGVIDIGLEGKMLFAAFAAGAAGVAFGSTALALLLAVLVTIALSWLHGLACVSHRGDQVVSGVAVNIIAVGLTAVLGIAWFAQGGQTPPVTSEVRLQAVLPGAATRVCQASFKPGYRAWSGGEKLSPAKLVKSSWLAPDSMRSGNDKP